MPNIYTLIEQQRAQLLAADDAYLASLTRGWQSVEDALQSRIEALAQSIAASAAQEQTINENMLYREARYIALLQQTRSVISEYAGDVAVSLEQQQQAFSQAGVSDARAVLDEAAVTPSFNVLPRGATNVAIGLAGDGSPLRSLLAASWPDAVQGMTNVLIRNTALGVNPRKTAREMQQATGGSLVRMLAIARTEQLRAYRESSRATYKDAGVKRYKRLAAHNKRTCYLCLGQDGKEQDANQPLAVHVNCRCTLVPLIDGYTLPAHQTGEEWLRQQSAATQREILGKGRYEMWQDGTALDVFGAITNDPTWGPTLKARTVVDVKTSAKSVASAPKWDVPPVWKDAGRVAREQLAAIRVKRDAKIAAYQVEIDRLRAENRAIADRIVDLPYKEHLDEWDQTDKNTQRYIELQRKQYELEAKGNRAQIEKIIFAKEGEKTRLSWHGTAPDKATRKLWEKASNDFMRMIGGFSEFNGHSVSVAMYNTSGRANASLDTIHMYIGDDAGTVVHELGHVFSFSRGEYLRRAVEFRDRRTVGDIEERMADLFPNDGYEAHEITKKDQFLHPYIGSQYRHKDGRDYGEEVISMGMQYMYNDPVKFAQDDPDHFDLVWSIMRGYEDGSS